MPSSAALGTSRFVAFLALLAWAGSSIVIGMLLYRAYEHDADTAMTLRWMGWILAGVGLSACVVGMRIISLAPIAFAAWFGAFGWWFPMLQGRMTPTIDHWTRSVGLHDTPLMQALPVPLAVLCAGLATAAVLLVSTGSAKLVLRVVVLSAIAGFCAIAPGYERIGIAIGALIWSVGCSASILAWGVEATERTLGLRCKKCNTDLAGLVAGACPGCGHDPRSRKSAKLAEAMGKRRVAL